MYAIIESGGKQFRVRRDARVKVPSLAGEVGDHVTFGRVLYASDGDDVRVGAPLVDGVRVMGEIVRHGRGRKVVVYKMKRRHRYRRKQGHRQGFTEVTITDLSLAGGEGRTGGGGDGDVEEEIGTQPPAGPRRQVGPYVCESCGRGFATERGLQQHRAKAHTGPES